MWHGVADSTYRQRALRQHTRHKLHRRMKWEVPDSAKQVNLTANPTERAKG